MSNDLFIGLRPVDSTWTFPTVGGGTYYNTLAEVTSMVNALSVPTSVRVYVEHDQTFTGNFTLNNVKASGTGQGTIPIAFIASNNDPGNDRATIIGNFYYTLAGSGVSALQRLDIFGTVDPYYALIDTIVTAPPTISSFNPTPARDSSTVTSIINTTELISKIQSDSTDTYFDSTSELFQVELMYTHSGGRQMKRIRHGIDGTNLTGSVSWTPTAQSGSWLLTKIRAVDENGAEHIMERASIGSDSDITLA